MVAYLEAYYSYVLKLLAFKTPHERGFLVFSVPNAKDNPDGNALIGPI